MIIAHSYRSVFKNFVKLKITFGNGWVERLEFTYEKETAPGKVEILTEAAEVYQQVLDGRNIAKDSVTKEQLDKIFLREVRR